VARRVPLETRLGTAVATAAIAVLASPGPAEAFKTGDLLALLSSGSGNRIVAVDPDTGTVSDFSPRPGSGANLIDDGIHLPAGIASDPEGEVFVTFNEKLIEVDAATGVQHEVRGFNPQILGDFPLDLGTDPEGIAVSPVAPSGHDGRSIFIASDSAVYEVDRSFFFGTGASVFASYPGGFSYGNSLSAEDLGGGTVAVWTNNFTSVVTGEQGSLQSIYSEPTTSPQPELSHSLELGGVIYLTRIFGLYCSDNPSENGLYALSYNTFISAYLLTSFATGGDLSCPGVIAAVANPFNLYVGSNVSVLPARIIKVSGAQNAQTSILATFDNSNLQGLAVYAPEPAVALGEGAALFALLGLSASRVARRSARSKKPKVKAAAGGPRGRIRRSCGAGGDPAAARDCSSASRGCRHPHRSRTTSSRGWEQQISKLPSAGGSTGSGA
jgi:hypothetical protein